MRLETSHREKESFSCGLATRRSSKTRPIVESGERTNEKEKMWSVFWRGEKKNFFFRQELEVVRGRAHWLRPHRRSLWPRASHLIASEKKRRREEEFRSLLWCRWSSSFDPTKTHEREEVKKKQKINYNPNLSEKLPWIIDKVSESASSSSRAINAWKFLNAKCRREAEIYIKLNSLFYGRLKPRLRLAYILAWLQLVADVVVISVGRRVINKKKKLKEEEEKKLITAVTCESVLLLVLVLFRW